VLCAGVSIIRDDEQDENYDERGDIIAADVLRIRSSLRLLAAKVSISHSVN